MLLLTCPSLLHGMRRRNAPRLGRTATWLRAHSEKGPLRCAAAGCSHREPCSRHSCGEVSLPGWQEPCDEPWWGHKKATAAYVSMLNCRDSSYCGYAAMYALQLL